LETHKEKERRWNMTV